MTKGSDNFSLFNTTLAVLSKTLKTNLHDIDKKNDRSLGLDTQARDIVHTVIPDTAVNVWVYVLNCLKGLNWTTFWPNVVDGIGVIVFLGRVEAIPSRRILSREIVNGMVVKGIFKTVLYSFY